MEPRSAVYRSATPEDAVRAYHAEAKEFATSGYVPTAEHWSSEGDQQVLTVEYGYVPDQVPAVLASLASAVVRDVDTQPRVAPPRAAPRRAARTPIEQPVRVAPSEAAPSTAAAPSIEQPVRVAPSEAAPSTAAPPAIEQPVRVAPSEAAPSTAAAPSIERSVRAPLSRAALIDAARPSIEQPVQTQAKPQRSIRLLPLAVVAVLVIAGSLAASTGLLHVPGTSSPPQADGGTIPPTGTIWFGSSFDTTSNSLLGQADSLPLGKPVAFVAHLNRASTGEVVGLQLDVGGSPASLPGGQVISGADLIGEVLPATAIYQAGTLTVRVLDVGGNILAIGTLTILP